MRCLDDGQPPLDLAKRTWNAADAVIDGEHQMFGDELRDLIVQPLEPILSEAAVQPAVPIAKLFAHSRAVVR